MQHLVQIFSKASWRIWIKGLYVTWLVTIRGNNRFQRNVDSVNTFLHGFVKINHSGRIADESHKSGSNLNSVSLGKSKRVLVNWADK